MKTFRFLLALLAGVAFAGGGCAKKKKEVSESERKRAELLMSEAESATLFRNWAEAEEKVAQAVQLCPDAGAYWIALGKVRKKLGKTDGAKTAYKGALTAFEEQARAQKPPQAGPSLAQVEVLLLLGRADDARKLFEKTAQQFPNDADVLRFGGGRQIDAMLADPRFKEWAL